MSNPDPLSSVIFLIAFALALFIAYRMDKNSEKKKGEMYDCFICETTEGRNKPNYCKSKYCKFK